MDGMRLAWKRFTRVALLATLLLVVLAAAACGGKAPEPTATPVEAAGRVTPPAAVSPAPQQVAPSPTPQPAPPTQAPAQEPTPTPVPTLAPTPEAFADWWEALQGAETFRGRTTIKGSDGTDVLVELERVKEPPAARAIFRGMDAGGETMEAELVQVEGILYMRTKEDGEWSEWMSMRIEQGMQGLSPTEMFFMPFVGLTSWEARDLDVVDRHEDVNGIDTTHYRVADTAMARFIRMVTAPGEQEEDLAISNVQADFWVANKGDFLAKVHIHFEGTEQGEPITGDIMSEILAVNEPLEIRPPAGAAKPGLPEDVPTYPGAELVASMQGMVSFTVAASVKEVAEFYKQELPARGWTLQEGGMETEDMAMYTFAKGEQTCQVVAMQEEGATTLNIVCQ